MKQNKKKKGFTLVEALVTVIIVTLLSMVLVSLSDLANATFTKLTRDAQGQILASTLKNAIESELRYADGIELYSNGDEDLPYNYRYYSKSSGLGSDSVLTNYTVDSTKANGDKIHKSRIGVVKDTRTYQLISEGSYAFDLEAKITSKLENGLFHVTITIFYGNDINNVVKESSFTVIPENL